MTLKATIHKNVPAGEIHKKVAHEFSALINPARLDEKNYMVICYPTMRNNSTSIVDSKSLEKLLRKANSENVIVVAHGFTSEASDLAEKNNALLFYKSDFYWTDESWAEIRDK